MCRAVFSWPSLLSLLLTVVFASKAWSDEPNGSRRVLTATAQTNEAGTAGPVCRVYQLRELATDAKAEKWLVETLKKICEPTAMKGARVFSYNDSAKVLVLKHDPRVHAEVAALLSDLRKATAMDAPKAFVAAHGSATGVGDPARRAMMRTHAHAQGAPVSLYEIAQMSHKRVGDAVIINQIRSTNSTYTLTVDDLAWLTEQGVSDVVVMEMQQQSPARKTARTAKSSPAGGVVVPAAYPVPGTNAAAKTATDDSLSYPVPAPVARPKHLFHYIVRYEGDGIIDANVVDLFKSLYAAETSKAEKEAERAKTAPVPADEPKEGAEKNKAEPAKPLSRGTGPQFGRLLRALLSSSRRWKQLDSRHLCKDDADRESKL